MESMPKLIRFGCYLNEGQVRRVVLCVGGVTYRDEEM